MGLLYRKLLKISTNNINSGDLMNALLTDTDRVCYQYFGEQNILAIIATIIMSIFMIFYIGYECFIIFLVLFIIIPLSMFIAKKLVLKKGFKYADKRIKFLNEIIKGIRIIKMYGWEIPVKNYIKKIRKNELNN